MGSDSVSGCSLVGRKKPCAGFLEKSLIALSLCAALSCSPALADDACRNGRLPLVSSDDGLVLWFSDVPEVRFHAVGECNPLVACEFSVLAQDVDKVHIVVESLNIEDFCSAFKRKQQNESNVYFESSQSTVALFEKVNSTVYDFKGGTRLTIEVIKYHNGKKDTEWGFYESPFGAGRILSLGVRSVRIDTGSNY